MIGALIARRNVPKAYDVINRHDLEAFLEDFSEDLFSSAPEPI
jgi:hypothetical protein